jgi:hypothetical protein
MGTTICIKTWVCIQQVKVLVFLKRFVKLMMVIAKINVFVLACNQPF